MSQYFHFTLGPVQSFVGQARRTRDFWAGSFLLSWLSGVAMLAVKKQGGKIIFPKADRRFLDAIEGKSTEALPRQGSIPNRFKAKVGDDFKAQAVTDAVNKAWQALAKKVYDQDLAALEKDYPELGNIWRRQIEHFWEMNWILTTHKEDSSGLDQRKNWRSGFHPEEAGIKCSLMGDWQELSGIVGVKKADREAREQFWRRVAENGRKTDFADNQREQLCALAFIKRRFDRVFNGKLVTLDALMDRKTGEPLSIHGWDVPVAVPSVAYIAAAPWFASVLQKERGSDMLMKFVTAARDCADLPEYQTALKCIRKVESDKNITGIDGNTFFDIALENRNIFSDREKAGKVRQALQPLCREHGVPSPFYAVLMMDGDHLGRQMSDTGKQGKISTALNQFTQNVGEIVDQYSGFLIYAGGDDVLALLPLEYALSCAAAIRQHYEACFAEYRDIVTSISAAIIYTHINSPLKNVLHDAHTLLDDIAKEKTGRDALAVRVYKGSGLAVEWAKPWAEALDTNDKLEIEALVERFQKQDHNEESAGFSSKFFYRIRQRFALFDGGNTDDSTLRDALKEVLCLDFIQSADNRKKITLDEAREAISTLMQQCQQSNKIDSKKDNLIQVDAALLVRFLAQKGLDR